MAFELRKSDNENSTASVMAETELQPQLNNDRDAIMLAHMGKKQVLKRRFGFISMLSFSCTILATWEGVLILFATGFENGGPPGLVYQFIMVWGGTLCTFVSIAELASMAPTSGGQYHWVAMLAPKSMRNFMSYITGWMTVLAWIATIASGAFLSATMIQGICLVNYPNYGFTYKAYQGTLITWAVVLVCVFFNTVIGSLLPKVEAAFLILHILGFFAILIPLVHYGPKGDASELFSSYFNEGGWPTYGLSFMVGSLGAAFSFAGADAAVHMSEEIENASVNVPRSIVASVIINGALGFGMLIATIFTTGNPEDALNAVNTLGFPFIEIFLQATKSIGGATAMTSILIALAISSTIGFLATGSRMIWSFARDKGLPFSDILSRVSKKSTLPFGAILVASVIPCLIALINIGSTTAFNDIISLTLAALYSTYFISCFLLLYRRLGSSICKADTSNFHAPATLNQETGEYELTWGPWHIPGWLGIINNIIACAYLVTIWIFGFFPPATPVVAKTMNYSSLVFGATLLYSMVYYAVWGRKQYKGPIVEIFI